MLNCVNPVVIWLKELRISIEVEYLNALQAKSVATTPTTFEAFLIRDSHIIIERIREISTQIINNLDNFIDQIPIIHNDLKIIKTNFLEINFEIQEIVKICGQRFVNYTSNKDKLLDSVWKTSQQINKLIEFYSYHKSVNNSQFESTLRKLKQNFGELINHLIKNESKAMVNALHKRSGMLSVKWSLLSCCSLAQNDAYICRVFIEFHEIIEPLLQILITYRLDSEGEDKQIKAIALRLLTILCTNSREGVQTLLQKCLYNQFLSATIAKESNDIVIEESLKLMAELSQSLIETNDYLKSDVWTRIVVNDFAESLASIMKKTDNQKIFLLSCSSVANISFVDNECLIENDILNLMINTFNKWFDNILIRDQIITVMANIARKYPLEVVRSGGLVFILDSLRLNIRNFQEIQQISALERIQQKMSVAIARLTSHQSVAQIFFRLNVIQRLIELCKEPEQRNFNQNVMIACMAALKRLARVGTTDTKRPITTAIVNE